MFDVAVNHTSDEHPWFRAARADRSSPRRDWYHWSDTDTRYSGARPVFKGMVDSCWTWSDEAGQYYFHRFYDFQPDLNYAQPAVTSAMIGILASWMRAGVSGFRLDAAPMLWKAEGTSCESLPETHLVIKIFRAALSLLGRECVLLAEANMPAASLREYFGDGDECHAAFHFPLLPRIWQALRREDPRILAEAAFPSLPRAARGSHSSAATTRLPWTWSPRARGRSSCRSSAGSPRGSSAAGRVSSGRLFELLGRDPDWTFSRSRFSFPFRAPPVLYYGDEIAATNNVLFFREKSRDTGYPDSRFIHRGPFDAARAAHAQADAGSPEGRVLAGLRRIVEVRGRAPTGWPRWNPFLRSKARSSYPNGAGTAASSGP